MKSTLLQTYQCGRRIAVAVMAMLLGGAAWNTDCTEIWTIPACFMPMMELVHSGTALLSSECSSRKKLHRAG